STRSIRPAARRGSSANRKRTLDLRRGAPPGGERAVHRSGPPLASRRFAGEEQRTTKRTRQLVGRTHPADELIAVRPARVGIVQPVVRPSPLDEPAHAARREAALAGERGDRALLDLFGRQLGEARRARAAVPANERRRADRIRRPPDWKILIAGEEKAQTVELLGAGLLGEPLARPEAFIQPQHDPHDLTHREPLQRLPFGAELRVELDRAGLAGRRLQDTERHGDDRGPSGDARTRPAVGIARFHDDIARRPAHARRDRVEPNAIANRRREPVDDPIVAVDHAADAALAHVAARAPAAGERAFADPRRLGGVKTFDVLKREAAIVRQPSPTRFPLQERLERTVGRALWIEPPHHAVEPLPVLVQWAEMLARYEPPAAADVVAGERRLPQDLVDLRRAAMDEFGAELDRNAELMIALGEYASANPLPRLEHDDVHVVVDEGARGSEPSGSGPDDHDLGCRRRRTQRIVHLPTAPSIR